MRVPVVRVVTAAIRVRVPVATTALRPAASMLRPRQRRRRALGRAAALAHTVVYTLQQTFIPLRGAGVAITIRRPAIGTTVVMSAIEAELGLNGGAVDAVCVEALADGLGDLHVACSAALGGDVESDLDVQAGNDLGVRELPDVDVVAGDDAGDVLDVLLNVVDVEVVRGGLEEDLGRGGGQGDGGAEDDEGDEEGDGRVGIEAVRGVGEPDDERGDNDADVAEGIADDVEYHGTHAQVGVVVAVTAATVLSGLVVVVAGVPRVLADSLVAIAITSNCLETI